MSPTIDEQISHLRVEIEELDRSLGRWADRSMPAYQGTLQRRKQKQAILDSFVRQQEGADQWQDFRSKFTELADTEQQLVQQYVEATGRKDEPYLYAYRTPESGRWKSGGGVGEDLREQFHTLAARAGIALRSPKGTAPEEFWLHRLYHYLRQIRSKHLFEQHVLEPSQEGGGIRRVCQNSATFCSRLERQAPEQSEPGSMPESSGVQKQLAWQEIEITFLSDHRVEICCGANRNTYNYGELGFQDRRSGKSQEPKPTRAWVMLCGIAQQKGTLPRPPAGKNRA